MFTIFRRGWSHNEVELSSVELVFTAKGFICSLLRIRYCPWSCLQLVLGIVRLSTSHSSISWGSFLGLQFPEHHVVKLPCITVAFSWVKFESLPRSTGFSAVRYKTLSMCETCSEVLGLQTWARSYGILLLFKTETNFHTHEIHILFNICIKNQIFVLI